MKAKNISEKKKLPKNFKINKSLTNKYVDQPWLKEKIERANNIFKTIGLPKVQDSICKKYK